MIARRGSPGACHAGRVALGDETAAVDHDERPRAPRAAGGVGEGALDGRGQTRRIETERRGEGTMAPIASRLANARCYRGRSCARRCRRSSSASHCALGTAAVAPQRTWYGLPLMLLSDPARAMKSSALLTSPLSTR